MNKWINGQDQVVENQIVEDQVVGDSVQKKDDIFMRIPDNQKVDYKWLPQSSRYLVSTATLIAEEIKNIKNKEHRWNQLLKLAIDKIKNQLEITIKTFEEDQDEYTKPQRSWFLQTKRDVKKRLTELENSIKKISKIWVLPIKP